MHHWTHQQSREWALLSGDATFLGVKKQMMGSYPERYTLFTEIEAIDQEHNF